MSRKLAEMILISDMDGTLINPDLRIPQRNLDAIARFTRKGGRFTVASGRSPRLASVVLDQISFGAPAICNNGATIYDYAEGKTLYERRLGAHVRAYVDAVLHAFSDVCAGIVRDDHLYVVGQDVSKSHYLRGEKMPITITTLDQVPDGWHKALFECEAEHVQQVDDFLQSLRCEGVNFTKSSDNYFEMLPEGVSKGSALDIYCELLDVSLSQIAVIGDYYNDLEIIRRAGIGAATAGAPEDVRRHADFVAGDYREGAVADFIAYLEQVCKV